MQRQMGGTAQVFYNVTVQLCYFPSFPKYDNQKVAQFAKPDRLTGVQTCSGVFLFFLNKPNKPLFPFSLWFFSLTEDFCSSSPPGQTQKSLLDQTNFCGQTSVVWKLLVQYYYIKIFLLQNVVAWNLVPLWVNTGSTGLFGTTLKRKENSTSKD